VPAGPVAVIARAVLGDVDGVAMIGVPASFVDLVTADSLDKVCFGPLLLYTLDK